MGAPASRGAVSLATIVGVLLAVAPAASAAGIHARDHRLRHETSANWSGYALIGPGPYNSVSASWTQPAVNCAVTRNGYSAFWVGLDGYTTETVEQTGTEANCSGGKPVYGAWYEMFPRGSVRISEPVVPGDSISASVTYLGKAFFGLTSRFELTLSDATQGWSQSETKYMSKAKLGSAEAIAEAPSDLLGVLPLSDFGTVGFSGVTVNGSLVSASTPALEPITMESEAGVLEAEPSAISAGSFSDTWLSR
jgi:peptidase A4-like protein